MGCLREIACIHLTTRARPSASPWRPPGLPGTRSSIAAAALGAALPRTGRMKRAAIAQSARPAPVVCAFSVAPVVTQRAVDRRGAPRLLYEAFPGLTSAVRAAPVRLGDLARGQLFRSVRQMQAGIALP